jgi:hypothetical protein
MTKKTKYLRKIIIMIAKNHTNNLKNILRRYGTQIHFFTLLLFSFQIFVYKKGQHKKTNNKRNKMSRNSGSGKATKLSGPTIHKIF